MKSLTPTYDSHSTRNTALEGEVLTGISNTIVQQCLDYQTKIVNDFMNNGQTHDSRTAAHHILSCMLSCISHALISYEEEDASRSGRGKRQNEWNNNTLSTHTDNRLSVRDPREDYIGVCYGYDISASLGDVQLYVQNSPKIFEWLNEADHEPLSYFKLTDDGMLPRQAYTALLNDLIERYNINTEALGRKLIEQCSSKSKNLILHTSNSLP